MEPEDCGFLLRVSIGDKGDELGVLGGPEIGPSYLRRNPTGSLLGSSLGEGHGELHLLEEPSQEVPLGDPSQPLPGS